MVSCSGCFDCFPSSAALTAMSPWRTSPCATSSPSTRKRCPGRRCAGATDSSGACCRGCGWAGGRLSSSCHPTPSCGGSGAASASTGPSSPPGPSRAARPSMLRSRRSRHTDGCGQSVVGAPRIHGELLRLGIDVSERTVSRLMPKRAPPAVSDLADVPRQPCPRSRLPRFLHGAARAPSRPLCFRRAHHRRRVVHFNVTEHPAAH